MPLAVIVTGERQTSQLLEAIRDVRFVKPAEQRLHPVFPGRRITLFISGEADGLVNALTQGPARR